LLAPYREWTAGFRQGGPRTGCHPEIKEFAVILSEAKDLFFGSGILMQSWKSRFFPFTAFRVGTALL
jgi:hypothetical protein